MVQLNRLDSHNKNKGAISVSVGLGLLAFGEFLGWYSFVFPESIYININDNQDWRINCIVHSSVAKCP